MRAAHFPLFLAYAAYPLAAHAQRAFGGQVFRNWIDAAWAAAAYAALLALLIGRRPRVSRAVVYPAAAISALTALIALIRFGPQVTGGVEFVPWLMEMKPLFYLAVSALWFAAFGAPRPRSFIRYGLALSLMLLAEFAIASAIAGQPMRPEGSGEINYDACLALISLTMGLYSGRMPRWALLLIFAGLAATFSRTGLAAAAAIFVLAPDRGPAFKTLFASASIGFLLLSFIVRGLPMDAVEQLDRLCMWSAGLELLSDNPRQAISGFAPGLPLPVDVPAGIKALWVQQQRAWSLHGVFAYNFHSFWLRTAVTWGLAMPAAILAALVYTALRAGKGPLRGLAVLTGVMGLTMGLIYLSNVAVPLCLACLAATGRSRPPEEIS